jgi:RsiW-degrading membrane proteinase PrsW (M82 family)
LNHRRGLARRRHRRTFNGMWIVALALTTAAAGTAWARLAAVRAGERRVGFTLHTLLAGFAAFGLAFFAYDLATRVGLDVRWDRIARGDATAFLLAAAVGLVEEGAKLAGVLIVVDRGVRTRSALAVAAGVAAGFSMLETLLVLGHAASGAAFARAVFGPVAHALLIVPAALGVAPALRTRRPALALAVPLAASAALHGAGDLSLALPGIGHAGYALALAAPAVVLFARARRRRALPSPLATWK